MYYGLLTTLLTVLVPAGSAAVAAAAVMAARVQAAAGC
jgi:hypothetical protein